MDELISRTSRHRVRILGHILGETMAAHHGQAFLDKIEEIRGLAKIRRQEDAGDHSKLQRVLQSLDDKYLISVARAFNQFLNLTNIVEQTEITDRQSKEPYPENSYLSKLFDDLRDKNIPRESIVTLVKKLRCDLVLTAHPTEITRRTLIQKYNRIAEQIKKINATEEIAPDVRITLQRLLAEVWYTDEIRTESPSPQEEAKWGYAVIEHSLWQAIPEIWKGLDRLLLEHTGEQLPLTATPIRISSWMGGDRDGNPNVTARVTGEVIQLARWMAADLYLRDLDELLSRLSMALCNDKIRAMCGSDNELEPYRVVLRGVRERLLATKNWTMAQDPVSDDLILTREELFEPLHDCYTSLHECGMSLIAEGLLKETLIRIATFGVTLVELDIRQNADRHTELLSELTQFLQMGDYATWPEKARQDFVLKELETKRPIIPEQWLPRPSNKETLDTVKLIASHKTEGISGYVISMAKNPSDILAVVLLLRKCGVEQNLPVIPLFETLDDLENAAWTLERLLRIPWYTQYIGGHQQIMIGYSDSAKDAGQMAAAWAQYRAQEELVTVGEKYGVDVTLFHGRGGTVGRGGAPAREAILSQPPGSVKGSMRVTEQGEVIRFKYGSAALARHSLDLIVSATMEASLLPPPSPKENWRNLMDKLAQVARDSYLKTVRRDKQFIHYFEQSTPERELALLALGSRPARRTDQDSRSIDDLRAIPWVFAWTQKRLMLPAWLGTDAALNCNFAGKTWHILKEMLEDWPFFQSQMDMLEMVLSKADTDIAQHYDLVLVDAELQPMGRAFEARLRGLIKDINKIKGQSALLELSPAVKRSLDLRHPYTDPLHFLQIELLCRCRRLKSSADNGTKNDINKALLVTIAGIAASMRNTG